MTEFLVSGASVVGMETTRGMRGDPLERVQAYRIALALAECVRRDAEGLRGDELTRQVGGQLLRASGSIAANIAEGYSRGTTADRRRFYEYALGSVRECEAWYRSSLQEPPHEQLERLASLRRLLHTMVRNAREDSSRVRSSP